MSVRSARWIIACVAVTACESTGPGGLLPFAQPLEISFLGIPQSDTLRQTGLEFSFQTAGKLPYRSVVVVVDPGSPGERSFSTDSAWLAEAPARFPVVVGGPLANGSRVFELRVADADGRTGTARFTRTVHVPDVPYQLQFLGSGFDDSRAAGITPNGLIGGTLISGVSPSQTSQIVTWNNGVRLQPRSQSAITKPSATGINNLGEIVGSATVSGTTAGVFWRGDSLEVLKVNNQNTFFASDIDESHRALVFGPGGSTYLLDVNSGTPTQVSIGVPARMNGLGQIVSLSPQLYGTSVSTYGGLSIKYPGGRPGRHERLFRGVTWDIFALNDRGEVLGSREGDAFLSHNDTAEYLDQRLPRRTQLAWAGAAYTLSTSGDVVVVAGNDSLYVWSKAAGTRRLSFTNTGWKIDALVAMNASGQLVAHGVNSTTNEKGALLFSPAALNSRQR